MENRKVEKVNETKNWFFQGEKRGKPLASLVKKRGRKRKPKFPLSGMRSNITTEPIDKKNNKRTTLCQSIQQLRSSR